MTTVTTHDLIKSYHSTFGPLDFMALYKFKFLQKYCSACCL